MSNEPQRVCIWLVVLARTKLVKENEPEENPKKFLSIRKRNNELYALLAHVLLF